jgi:hypothetical protein
VSTGSNDPGALTVAVTEADTGSAVPGRVERDAWGRRFAAWKASSLLRPHTRYKVEAEVRSDTPIPAGAGRERLSFTFTTGEGRTPPLAITGRLEAKLESYERDDYSTCSPGHCNCKPTSRLRGTRARLTLPAISGGVGEGGYAANITVTADRPFDFAASYEGDPPHVYGSASRIVPVGQRFEVVVEGIDDKTAAYRPASRFEWRTQSAPEVSASRSASTRPCPPPTAVEASPRRGR